MSDPSSEQLTLAAEFPAATREQWLKLAEAVLKGAPFEKKLVSRTRDGLRIEPVYPRSESAPIAGRAPAIPWQVGQRVEHPDAMAANSEALHDLENGATALTLVFEGAVGAYGFGLDPSADAVARVLNGIHLDAGIALELDLGPASHDTVRAVAEVAGRRSHGPRGTSIRFGIDPIGAASVGHNPIAFSENAPAFATTIKELVASGFTGPHAVADGRVVHAAGGSEVQELAYVLAVGVAYLRALTAAGVGLDAARSLIFFRLAADADQFLTIAKFRALRQLWGRIEQASGLAPKPAFISAETAWRMMTRRDPWVNMLRTTLAAFSAGVAGASAVTVLPFTAALGLPDRFARRTARNTQLILLEESNLAKVTDPAAGSGGLEAITDQLCRAAWSRFQAIERAGGAAKALENGLVQNEVAEVRRALELAVAHRREPLTGTSEFPHLAEAPVAVLDIPRRPARPALVRDKAAAIQPLPQVRLAEPFEALRDRSDRVLTRTGSRPKVFLANLGTLAEFTARATFAKNFFEAGGLEAVANDAFADHTEMAKAFKACGTSLACLCSSDEVYRKEAIPAARLLAQAGCTYIYLAGRPGDFEADLSAAGVQAFVYAGCDAVATLLAAHDILGTNA